jgi:predicted membrane protein
MKNEKLLQEEIKFAWFQVSLLLGGVFAFYCTDCMQLKNHLLDALTFHLLDALTFIFILLFTTFILTFLPIYIIDKFINYYDKREKIIKENAIREAEEKAKQEAEELRTQSQIWVNE